MKYPELMSPASDCDRRLAPVRCTIAAGYVFLVIYAAI